jgi:hypothetical protein
MAITDREINRSETSLVAKSVCYQLTRMIDISMNLMRQSIGHPSLIKMHHLLGPLFVRYNIPMGTWCLYCPDVVMPRELLT